MICNEVITYYVPVANLWTDESQRALIALWKQSWQKYGWVATCLEENDVRSHPRFDFFNSVFRSKPTEYPADYSCASFMRWLAASHWAAPRSGYCLLTDYDVCNHGQEPMGVEPGKMKIFCSEPPSSVFMGCVLGSSQHFLDMTELFAAWGPDELDYNQSAKMYHQDDLSQLVRMFESGSRPKPDWFVKCSGCALFDYHNWRTEKIVHYGYQMRASGFWPKCDYVGKIRKF